MHEFPLEIGVAGRPLAGETESGDLHLVAGLPVGALLAVIDGLGHGPEAAAAARLACAALAEDPSSDLLELFARCHRRLARSRGAAMSLASVKAGVLTWLGVGNVEGTLLRADADEGAATESIPLRGGVLGYKVPSLRPSTTSVINGDMLVLVTDGISPGFIDEIEAGDSAQETADHILEKSARETDDALVLIARVDER